MLKIVGLIFTLLLASEIILRLTGMALVSPEREYKDLSADNDKFRILAVGESTTDDRFANGQSWSSQLEKLLLKRGHKVRIYNVGRVGSNTALLLSRLPDQLELYRPHLVISMMGINDRSDMYYDFEEPPLKLVKFLRTVGERIESRMSCEVQVLAPPKNATNDDFKRWLNLTSEKDLKVLEDDIRKKLSKDEDVSSVMGILGSIVRAISSVQKERTFFHLHERALQLHPMNDINLRAYLNALNGKQNRHCMTLIRKIIPCAVNLNDEYLRHISECLRIAGKPMTADLLKIRGISFISGKGTVPYHYEKLAELLKEKKIQLAAMQYPTLPIEGLKQNLKTQKGILFISNEENFRRALSANDYRKIFSDRFRATWGHTTSLGHLLIAESALEVIEPFIVRQSRR